jgi:serine/threonine protein kinase/Tfp pilus assembly protein PilF
MSIPSGKIFAHYEIVSPLGAGGMGEVYLARDTSLERLVALKFLPSEIAGDSQRLRRFIQEAKAASTLNHPNIAHIYEIGDSDGERFIAMEYVEGKSLDQKINGCPMKVAEMLQIAPQAADALNEAHSKGIVHRDIKSSNIVLTNRGQVKVLDFGLAKVLLKDPATLKTDVSTQLKTSPGIVIGTVPYMSPEQALGHEVDQRSDIFSLGVVLYEMSTGRLPFSGNSVTETISRITHEQPEAVSRFNYEVPAEFERIIRKCLEKDRDRRYQSASDLLVDLENLKRDSQSIGVATTSTITRKRNPKQRWLFLGVVVLAVLAIAGMYFFRRSETAKDQADRQSIGTIAVLPFVNSNGDQSSEYLSDGITENIINSLSQLPHLRVMARATVFRYKGKEVDPGTVGRELKVDAVVTGRVLQQADNLIVQADLVNVADGSQLWGEHYTRKAVDVFAIQDEIARQITDRLRLRLTGDEQKLVTKHYTENPEAYDLYLKGRYFWGKGTEAGFDKAIEYYRQAIALDPNYALAYVGMAASYTSLGGVLGFQAPSETYPKSKEFLMKALALDESLAEVHTSLATYFLNYEWNWAEAERQYKRAIELNPNYCYAHSGYGTYLEALGRFDEAISERQLAQKFDPLSPFINADAGYPYYYARRYDEAIEWYRKGLELDPQFSWGHLWIGQAYVQKGMFKEAIDEINQSIQLSGGDTRAKATLGHAYGVSGRRDDALKVLQELQSLSKERYVSPYYMALVSIGLGDNQQAVAWLKKAQEERQSYLILMKVEPVFDKLHSDPGFIAIERSVGLEP